MKRVDAMQDEQEGAPAGLAFRGIYDPMERDALISKEYRRLKGIFRDLPKADIAIMEKLMREAAFVAITLEEARKIIARDGIIETYMNGAAQFGFKKSSAVEVYDKMLNTYSKIVGQLCDRLPEDKAKQEAGAEAMSFVRARKAGAGP